MAHDPEADRKELQGEGGGPPGGTRRVVLGFADAASHESVDNQRENEGHECDGARGHDGKALGRHHEEALHGTQPLGLGRTLGGPADLGKLVLRHR